MDNSTGEAFFCQEGVERRCDNPLRIIFETLLLNKKVKQQRLADFCKVDKALISRIANGLYVPELRLRLKIAEFFGVDSALIWRRVDLEVIRKIKNEQVKNGKK